MYIKEWDLSFDSHFPAKVAGVTKKIEPWRILVRNSAIHITYKRNAKFKIDSEYRDLPHIFAEYLSGDKNSEKKIKKELTKLKKLGILYDIDTT